MGILARFRTKRENGTQRETTVTSRQIRGIPFDPPSRFAPTSGKMVAMSHRVDPADLATEAAPRGATPYLLYAGRNGSARVNHVHTVIEATPAGTTAICTGFGRGIISHVEDDGALSLLWPAASAGDFSLIADGTGSIVDDTLRISISDAVLHRPAPTDGGPATC